MKRVCVLGSSVVFALLCLFTLSLHTYAKEPLQIEAHYNEEWVSKGEPLKLDGAGKLVGTLYLVDDPDQSVGEKSITVTLYQRDGSVYKEFKEQIKTIPDQGRTGYLLDLEGIKGIYSIKVCANYLGFEGFLYGVEREDFILSLISNAINGRVINSNNALGASLDDVISELGDPDLDGVADGTYLSFYPYKHHKVSFFEHSFLGIVRIESEDQRLQDISLETFVDYMGEPFKIVEYDQKGVRYSFFRPDAYNLPASPNGPFIVVKSNIPSNDAKNTDVLNYAVSLWVGDLY